MQTPEKNALIILKSGQCGFLHAVMCPKEVDRMANREDPDQTAPKKSNIIRAG